MLAEYFHLVVDPAHIISLKKEPFFKQNHDRNCLQYIRLLCIANYKYQEKEVRLQLKVCSSFELRIYHIAQLNNRILMLRFDFLCVLSFHFFSTNINPLYLYIGFSGWAIFGLKKNMLAIQLGVSISFFDHLLSIIHHIISYDSIDMNICLCKLPRTSFPFS